MVDTPTHELIFEWDDDKAFVNARKHRIPFNVAVQVFLDPYRVDIDTTRTSDGEERRKVIGRIEDKLFCVVYTRRFLDVIRIISARRANVQERRAYDNPLSS